MSRDPHLSKPCDRHFPSKSIGNSSPLGGWDSRMTFAMRQSVMTARVSKSLSAELTFIDAKCEADHPAPECSP